MDGSAIAHALFDAVEAGDFDRFQALFSRDAVIWHNFDNRDQPVAETVALLGRARGVAKNSRYGDRRYVSLPDGAVCQHVLRSTLKDGRPLELHAMLRVHVEDGRVRRIEEYLDPAQVAAMAAELSAA